MSSPDRRPPSDRAPALQCADLAVFVGESGVSRRQRKSEVLVPTPDAQVTPSCRSTVTFPILPPFQRPQIPSWLAWVAWLNNRPSAVEPAQATRLSCADTW